MLLADSSVWIRHFREPDRKFQSYVDAARVLMHPFAIAELMLGGLRKSVLRQLDDLEQSAIASTAEMRFMIQEQSWRGRASAVSTLTFQGLWGFTDCR